MNEQDIEKAVEVLRRGGTILYPTDTIWGIGCDASNEGAVEKIYGIKQRDHAKSMLILALPEWTMTDNPVVQRYLDDARPTTVIVSWRDLYAMPVLARNLMAQDGSIGVRVPRGSDFCMKLLEAVATPIVSTSANLSGHTAPATYEQIDPAIIGGVDYVVGQRVMTAGVGCAQSSRIVKIVDDRVEVIRP